MEREKKKNICSQDVSHHLWQQIKRWALGGSEDLFAQEQRSQQGQFAAFKSHPDAKLDLIVWPPQQTVCLRRVVGFWFWPHHKACFFCASRQMESERAVRIRNTRADKNFVNCDV